MLVQNMINVMLQKFICCKLHKSCNIFTKNYKELCVN